MKAMNLSGVTKDDFIEFVAATYFRVQAILQALYALESLVTTFGLFVEDRQFAPPLGSAHSPIVRGSLHNVFISSVQSCIESVAMCALLFFLAVPLARLIRRSLSHACESPTTEVASWAGWIEPLAAVLFRALAVSIVLEAICGAARFYFVRFMGLSFASHPSSASFGELLIFLVPFPFLINILIPIALFVLSLYFARLLSAGLSRALSSNPVNLVNPV
jgi:hypothetical protein